jgi:nitronate monooxygenase
LIPKLKRMSPIPVISAGGVATGEGILSMLALGADGLSVGTPFIACDEAPISQDYKQACIDYGAEDIVMTTKLSGTPCTVINSKYVQKIGTDQNAFEKILNQNKQLKKYAKMLTHYKGMKALEKAAFSATYKSVWCAGPSLEFTEKVEPLQKILGRMWSEFETAKKNLQSNV